MLSLKNVNLRFRNFALRDINLNIESGSYFVIVGPTGAGKTLLLETIAGLQPAHEGMVELDNRDITRLQPEQRRMGLVYQDHTLFPHLNVAQNIGFGLRMRKQNKNSIKQKVTEAAALMRVENLLERQVERLSGGEKQKVALARALVLEPSVLLLDEPLGALDPESRETLRDELHRLHTRLHTTIVHVTHDFQEAIVLADKMTVIGEGQVKQTGTPSEIFRQPASVFVARFTMSKNILQGQISDGYFSSGSLRVRLKEKFSGPCFGIIRPEDIDIKSTPIRADGCETIPGTITEIIDYGATVSILTDVPPVVQCMLHRTTVEEKNLKTGQNVFLTFKTSSLRILEH